VGCLMLVLLSSMAENRDDLVMRDKMVMRNMMVNISGDRGDTARVFSPFQITNFPNTACVGATTSLTGTCYSTSECSGQEGGYADGTCASGFGTCCVLRVSGCGGDVTLNSTHIQNTGYSSAYKAAATCTYNLLKVDSEICFFRLDFVVFSLDVPASALEWVCSTDKLEFTTPTAKAPPTICGYNTGQHMYLDASEGLSGTNPAMSITTTGTTNERFWQIRVDQIYCGQTHTPPHGCVQYFTGQTGTITSYNYGYNDDFHHLGSQDYTICIRREDGQCKIGYHPSPTGNSFYLSFHPGSGGGTFKSRAGEDGCVADFITIPRGTNNLYGESSCISLNGPNPTTHQFRFCGQRLNCALGSVSNSWVYSDVVPFRIEVELNGAEPIANGDNKNRGFSLDYLQQSC